MIRFPNRCFQVSEQHRNRRLHSGFIRLYTTLFILFTRVLTISPATESERFQSATSTLNNSVSRDVCKWVQAHYRGQTEKSQLLFSYPAYYIQIKHWCVFRQARITLEYRLKQPRSWINLILKSTEHIIHKNILFIYSNYQVIY